MVELAPAQSNAYALGFAGDTYNTAWYLNAIAGSSVQVSYLTAIGNDAISEKFINFTQDAGIAPKFHQVDGKTLGLYLIELNKGERSFHYWRSTSAARDLASELGAVDELVSGDIAYFSGITLAILDEVSRVKLIKHLAQARLRGAFVAFDSNLRSKLWESNAEMCAWTMRAAEVADFAFPSFEDEEMYFADADKLATAQRYRDAGVSTVVVKDGPNSVHILAPDNCTHSVAPNISDSPVDTTAAGDSFNGAFLAAYFDAQPLVTCAKRGCETAHFVVNNQGALVQLPRNLRA
ncbi:2-dehydro-3-deoxygluconokinase [Amylibacter marinus]|uniref:2-dehydro-3-deoxygluconokinase n=2 Tax=Amylibacter marinus TaxID=1475483 RepID=A0ABQ5VRM4_9RHOB|nr:2-dehydro-3-deoxygluconokinase [Amylibacter marinus]